MTTEFDYKIIRASAISRLEAAVTEMLRVGYVPVGSPFVYNTGDGHPWHQAVERALNPQPLAPPP